MKEEGLEEEIAFSTCRVGCSFRTPLTRDDGTEVELGETPSEHTHLVSAKALTPEEELITKQKEEYEEALLAELHGAVQGDEDLELLLICFEEGIDKAHTIAVETGWDISKVYSLKRKLLRKAARIGRRTLEMKEE